MLTAGLMMYTFGYVAFASTVPEISGDAVIIESYSDAKDIVDIKISEDETIRYAVNASDTKVNTIEEYSISNSDIGYGIEVSDILGYVETVQSEREEAIRLEKERLAREAEMRRKTYSDTQTQGGLVDIMEPDPEYGRYTMELTPEDRDLLERLVMGEAGNQGIVGAALVAQAIKDTMALGGYGYETIDQLRIGNKYTGRIDREPNQDVLDAVAYVFDEGGYAVQHRIMYFYAPRGTINLNGFHETQIFVIEYGGHRVFDRRY